MKKIIAWLKESHRWQHLAGGLVIGLASDSTYCAAFAGLGIASALEFKDKACGGKWDWIDWSLTLAGVFVGRLIRIIL
jgi:hypothetical protein